MGLAVTEAAPWDPGARNACFQRLLHPRKRRIGTMSSQRLKQLTYPDPSGKSKREAPSRRRSELRKLIPGPWGPVLSCFPSV